MLPDSLGAHGFGGSRGEYTGRPAAAVRYIHTVVQIARVEVDDETGAALRSTADRRGQSVDRVLRALLGMNGAGGPEGSRLEGQPGGGERFDRVWQRICDLAGTEFTTRGGQRFTYLMDGRYVSPSTSDVRIPLSQFRKAIAIGPVRGPASFRGVFAPSLVWAIINDPRVAGEAGLANGTEDRSSGAQRPGDALGTTWPDDAGLDYAS
jgi:hypothetical protein